MSFAQIKNAIKNRYLASGFTRQGAGILAEGFISLLQEGVNKDGGIPLLVYTLEMPPDIGYLMGKQHSMHDGLVERSFKDRGWNDRETGRNGA